MKTIKRRRRENKTDYAKRLKFLKSDSPRIVFRKTNKYVLAQYITTNQSQDKIEFSVNSKDLLKFGWPKDATSGLKSLPASYLIGLLMGTKIIDKKQSPILDLGMYRIIQKGKMYGFLKGLFDSGIKISYKKDVLPEESRIRGDHLKKKIPFDEIKSKIMGTRPSVAGLKKK
ncbi:MAG: 50S ribosomal protein L18 [Nanoarchaeota archaeon]|nr:50S ribosomal protein L18 [Nanoarchaeota archaeon]